MTTLIIIFSVLGFIEIRFKPRFDYVKVSSVLVFYYFARKNLRKRVVFKL